MSEQDGKQMAVEQCPVYDGMITWQDFWKQLGQPWRTEPMIDADRQKYLTEKRSFIPDLNKALYPFGGITLSRADVEWLLSTHENGRGPVDWNDETQRNRKGLDLRGADPRGVDLSGLPLSCLLGGDLMEFGPKTDAQIEAGAIHLEEANLFQTHLEGAKLRNAHLEEANLYDTYLEEAILFDVHLERAKLIGAHLGRAMCFNAHLENANLSGANLVGAKLSSSNLADTVLSNTNLRRANLYQVHLERADLTSAQLGGASLIECFFDSATRLKDITLGNDKDGFAYLVDAHWADVNLAVIDWSAIPVLGEEPTLEKGRRFGFRPKVTKTPMKNYLSAVRAYRQLAVVLRNQGLNEDAARFAYRAQLMQRKVFWYQGKRKFRQYLFSLFIDLLAGYGYKPWRSFVTYLLVITTFAAAYFIIGHTVGPALSPLGSFIFSMTSFHGRGFFPGGIGLDDPLTVLAALEAFIGLLIEVTFIATLTQRLFGK